MAMVICSFLFALADACSLASVDTFVSPTRGGEVGRICSEAYGIDLKRQTGKTHPLTSWTCLCASSALVSPRSLLNNMWVESVSQTSHSRTIY
jgi:hypothetical protein